MRDSLPKGLLFDFDGVIAHTEPLHYRAFIEALEPMGVRITWEEYIAGYLGYDDARAMPVALATIGRTASAEEVARLVKTKNVAYEQALADSDPVLAGAKRFIRQAAQSRPCVIVSMARRRHIEMMLARAGLADCFSAIVPAEEVAAPKPDPQGYRKGLEHLKKHRPGLQPAQCLVVEDSLPGIQAGQAAGCRVLAVATTHPADTLQHADAVVEDLLQVDDELLSRLFG